MDDESPNEVLYRSRWIVTGDEHDGSPSGKYETFLSRAILSRVSEGVDFSEGRVKSSRIVVFRCPIFIEMFILYHHPESWSGPSSPNIHG